MNRESIWKCADGSRFKIRDMETSHIRNSLFKIYRGNWRPEYKEILEQELKLRESKLYKSLK